VSSLPAQPERIAPERRLAIDAYAPAARTAMRALEGVVRKFALPAGLAELVRLRASQLNGCAYCVDVHSRDALAHEETERRVLALPVWREAPFFTAKERAALDLAEAMTRLADRPVSDQTFDAAAAAFTPQELAELIWVIAVANTWHRICATTRAWGVV
jgi:AhpD family alkylhydroperoxidase